MFTAALIKMLSHHIADQVMENTERIESIPGSIGRHLEVVNQC
jgi:hypothetical protein